MNQLDITPYYKSYNIYFTNLYFKAFTANTRESPVFLYQIPRKFNVFEVLILL